MAEIEVTNLGVQFVFYEGQSRSLKHAAFHSTVGGVIGRATSAGRTTVDALSDVSFTARDGDRIALLGHNGAGKTTLLRALAGIYHPTHGTIRKSGRCMPLLEIGLGFDGDATGYENIVLRGLVMGLSRREITTSTDQIAEFSGLGEFLNLPVRTYSTGMQLRLMFSIASAPKADIILMDEWIATGDAEFLVKANARLREMVSNSNILMIATHNLALVRSLCNRVITFDGGRIVSDEPASSLPSGSPDEAPSVQQAVV